MNYFGLFFSFTIPGILLGMGIMIAWFRAWAKRQKRNERRRHYYDRP